MLDGEDPHAVILVLRSDHQAKRRLGADQQAIVTCLVGYLAAVGARTVTMTKAQEMKLREWIVPYINTEFELNSAL